MAQIRLAAKYTILSDALCRRDDDTEEYTSLLFKGMKVGNNKHISPKSCSEFLLDKIKSQDFYCYFPYAELNAISEELQKYAKPPV